MQSYMTVFLGGLTTGNIGSKEAGLGKAIAAISDQVNQLAAALPKSMDDLSEPLTLSLWIMLLTMLVILAANAYYANLESSPVGNRCLPALQPVSPATVETSGSSSAT